MCVYVCVRSCVCVCMCPFERVCVRVAYVCGSAFKSVRV